MMSGKESDHIECLCKKHAMEFLEMFNVVRGINFATEARIVKIVGWKAAKIKEY